jgi:aspartate/methionine/tyrosine aminotransferase
MRIDLFAMERMQSTWENLVEFNLAESGVFPLRLEELLDDRDDLEGLLRQDLRYSQSNGTPELREVIAGMYPGATIEHVEVTNGGSEANFLCCWQLLEPGDEVVLMVPNYMQIWGLGRAFGAVVRDWPLVEPANPGQRWTVDLAALERAVTPRTKLIALCNPNNPTAARTDEEELDAICGIAARHGAWILSDEIYRGAELDGRETPSVWGRYDRVLITSGLSKAYGLPGLRIGWIVGPPAAVTRCWSYHDYTTIAPSTLSDRLARVALVPARRARILARTRSILNRNYPLLEDWLAHHGEAFVHARPEAGAIAFVRYTHPIDSIGLVTKLREEKGVLVVPGGHFQMEGYLRIGYGYDINHLREGLSRLDDLLVPRASAAAAD